MSHRRLAIISALTIAVLRVLPASAVSAPIVKHVALRPVSVEGARHTYEATVVDSAGGLVRGATLDIGGLADDPDLRAVTTPMRSLASDSTRYRATLTFPADGSWMLVVRVHAPSEKVELVTTTIVGAGTRVSHHDLSSNPSRRALLRDDPSFAARYDPYGALAAAGSSTSPFATVSATHDHAAAPSAVAPPTVDAVTIAFAMMHALGAIAWIASVALLVLANRLGPGHARNGVFRFVADRYLLLAGGGLLTVVITGLQLVQRGSAGITDPRALLRSGLGTAYLAVFACKMAIACASIATSVRIGRLLPSPAQRARSMQLASVGAMADDGPPSRVLSLAEANAVHAALILLSVTVLSQLHHALH